MNERDPADLFRMLERLADDLPGMVRALTPNMMEFRPKAGEGTVSEQVAVALKTAAVLKAVLESDDLHAAEVKAPSFASAEEAADILESALRGAMDRLSGSEEYWRSSVLLEGSDKWRGETRLPVAMSLIEDMDKTFSALKNVVDTAAFT